MGNRAGIVEAFIRELQQFIKEGLVTFLPRHQVDELIDKEGTINKVKGSVLAPTNALRGEKSNRTVTGMCSLIVQKWLLT